MIEKPRIRPVEAFPISQNDETVICLRDPTGLAPDPIAIGMGAYFLVTLFDGTNDLHDLQNAFVKRFGERLPQERLTELIEALDHAYYLDSPAFKRRSSEIREEFLRRADRPAIHAGLCYAPEAALARQEIESFFASPEGPGTTQPEKNGKSLAGLIAPHIDPRRGAAAYAHAYAELRAHQPPELVIILGTSHYGAGPELFSATRKDYATPFGPARTDREFLGRVAGAYRGGDLFADELLHRNEHSIEFQALFLKWALEGHDFSIAPILVTSFHEMITRGAMPRDDRRVGSFVDVLSRELARERRRVLILSAVDFAHVGRKFGDEFSV
ncbi:MAG TPA: AmmeMemoRadiSam system protein B, partial [Candidatus Binataceae bacterium]|nr:AmmeMemoRadiSam system protein B [Candidatus Binataceae bacterium]